MTSSATPPLTPTVSSPALVVGGTGMLAGVVRTLVAEGCRTAVVARRASGIDRVAQSSAQPPDVVPVLADYGDPRQLREALERALQTEGRFRTAVLWVHTPFRDTALGPIADVLTEDAHVIDVRGSAIAHPDRSAEPAPPCLTRKKRRYEELVLGFAEESGRAGGTRWLTHSEISEGVADVLRRPCVHGSRRVVGKIKPWRDRPG